MSETQRVKISEDCVINIGQITNALRSADGRVVISFCGSPDLTLSGEPAEAFWNFYASWLYGCVDIAVLFPRQTEATQSVKVFEA